MRHSITSRRAFDTIAALPRFDTLFDELNRSFATVAAPWAPAVDIEENSEAFRIVAELPGIAPEQVKITFEQRVLTIAGEKTEAERTDAKPHRRERSWGAFRRSFTLPEGVDAERITAAYANGVLTITVPKAAAVKPREIPVQVAG
jgi:HSP20 family protein